MFNGQINLAKRIPEFVGKLFIYLVRDHEAGPGMYRYVERVDQLPRDAPPLEPERRLSVLPQAIEHESGIERERSRERQR
jgi:hypothetical protein